MNFYLNVLFCFCCFVKVTDSLVMDFVIKTCSEQHIVYGCLKHINKVVVIIKYVTVYILY